MLEGVPMSTINKISLGININDKLVIEASIDGVNVGLEINPFFLLGIDIAGQNSVFRNHNQEELEEMVEVIKSEEKITWLIPANIEYGDIAGKVFTFDKKDFVDTFHNAIFNIISKTSPISDINRNHVSVGSISLKKFIKENKDKIMNTLEVQ